MERDTRRTHRIWNKHNPDDLIRTDKEEIIHHKNEDYTDDRIENLEKMTRGNHNIIHHKGIKRIGVALENIRKTTKRGKDHPNFGKPTPIEVRKKLSLAMSGGKNPMYGKPTYGHLGKKHSEETKEKIRQSHLGKKHTEEAKRKMSLKRQGINNPFYGKTWDEENRKRIGENTRNFIKEKGHPKGMLGKTHSDEYKKRLSDRFSGSNNVKAKKVIYNNTIYDTLTEASNSLGISIYRLKKMSDVQILTK